MLVDEGNELLVFARIDDQKRWRQTASLFAMRGFARCYVTS